MKVILWWKLSCDESYLVMKVKLSKKWKGMMSCDVSPVAMFYHHPCHSWAKTQKAGLKIEIGANIENVFSFLFWPCSCPTPPPQTRSFSLLVILERLRQAVAGGNLPVRRQYRDLQHQTKSQNTQFLLIPKVGICPWIDKQGHRIQEVFVGPNRNYQTANQM